MEKLLQLAARWLPTSARGQLALLFAGLALVVAAPGLLYLEHVGAGRLAQDRQAALRDLAQAAAVVLSENLRERQQEVDYLAATAPWRGGQVDAPELTSSLEALKKAYPTYTWIGFADARGQVRAATGDLLVGASVANRPWFGHGGRGRYVGDLHEAVLLAPLLPSGPDGPPRFIDFAAPVIGPDGELRGVLGAHAHWGWARQVMDAVLPLEAERRGLQVLIANRRGEVLFPGQPGSVRLDAGIDYLSASAAVREVTPATPLGWQVVVRQPRALGLQELDAMRQVLVLSALAGAALFTALAWWLATVVTRPLRRVSQLAQRIEQGEENLRLRVPTMSREINQMVEALCGMAGMLVRRRSELAQANAQLELRVAERTEALSRANAELYQLARVDALTGLANRLAANERLLEEFARLRRSGHVYSLLVVDADHFKRINDTHGHEAGDQMLRHLARLMRETMRQSDFIARMGGEEFLVLLPDTGQDGALEAARKLCEAVRQAPAPSGLPAVTVSIGLAQALARHADPDEALREADRWLYVAKSCGRDRVAHAPSADAPVH